MGKLDRILTFLFINTKAKTRLFRGEYNVTEFNDANLINVQELNYVKLIYEKQIKRYFLGLGFFLSFIPGTEAFIARKELYKNLITHPKSSAYEFLDPIVGTLFGTMSNYTWGRDFDFDEAFFKLIHGTGAKYWVHHPINIFQYLAGMLESLRHFFWNEYEFNNNPEALLTRFGFGILLAIDFLLLVSVIFLLVIPTEFVLNMIDTLIFDPLRFIVEEIKQSYDYYDKEFLYVPSEEYNIVKMINNALNIPAQENSTTISANQYTLEISSSEKKNQYTTCVNGLFFKTYKNEPMFWKKDHKAIAAAHRTLENLERFYFFNKSMDVLPKDMVNLIAAVSLENEMTEDESSIQFV
ncbi:MAG: hypothetical protein H0T84_12045 [Tatlockia sp.]|nr:hypothetical protein [Tatlockia sp.]